MREFAPDLIYNSGALTNASVARAAACRVHDVVVSYTGGTKVYAQLHDAASLPANGAVPLAIAPLDPTVSGFDVNIGSLGWPKGRPMRNGIVVAISSTAATLTLAAGEESIIDVTFGNF